MRFIFFTDSTVLFHHYKMPNRIGNAKKYKGFCSMCQESDWVLDVVAGFIFVYPAAAKAKVKKHFY